ncbi:unnamed protein product, partial [Phaeothamnion confervicola]
VYSHNSDKTRFQELNDALSELVIDLHWRDAAAHMERSRREAEDLADQRADFERLQGLLQEAIESQRADEAQHHDETMREHYLLNGKVDGVNGRLEDILSALKHLRVATPAEIVGFTEVDFEQLQVSEVLGTGGFGCVMLGRLDDTPVAVKRVLQADADAKLVHATTFIVQLLAACTVAPHFALVMELAPFGSLHRVLYRRMPGESPLSLQVKVNMAYDVARGMLYLSKRGIVHGDIKSHNLLVFDNYRIKLCDFGLASVKTSICRASIRQAGGTVGWMAPETGDDDYTSPTPASDVYSYGMVLYELLAEQEPFAGQSPNVITVKVCSGKRPLLPDPVGGTEQPGGAAAVPALVALMARCWQQRPADRPAFGIIAADLRNVVGLFGG